MTSERVAIVAQLDVGCGDNRVAKLSDRYAGVGTIVNDHGPRSPTPLSALINLKLES